MYSSVAAHVEKACQRIKDNIRKTPLEYSAWLSECSNCNVYIKLESEQVTNSFKARGAFNKIKTVCESTDNVSEFVAASSGNHGVACCHVLSSLGLSCKVFVPTYVSSAKLKRLKQLKMSVVIHGNDCVDAENQGRKVAEETGAVYIAPYNDLDTLAGSGTIGCEIFEDLPSVDAIFISVGGGGLIAGVAAYLKDKNPSIKIIGCQPENSQVMKKSVEAGKILDIESLDTLSDGTAGGIEPGAITFDMCKELVDEWVVVSEEEIAYCIYKVLEEHSRVVEGASGVAIGAFLKTKEKYTNKNVVVISCGGNIAVAKLKSVIDKFCSQE